MHILKTIAKHVTFKLRKFFTLQNSNILSNMCETSWWGITPIKVFQRESMMETIAESMRCNNEHNITFKIDRPYNGENCVFTR